MNSGRPSTPSGDLDTRRVMEPSPIDFASVEYIASRAGIAEAWKKVRANKGAPGVDRISIEQFPKWKVIKEQLLEGQYRYRPTLDC